LIHRGPDSLGTVRIHAKQFLSQKGMVEVDKGIDDSMDNTSSNGCDATMDFVGASLQLRGTYPISQPLQDSSGNLLIFNGEVFGGLEIRVGKNDAEVLMNSLRDCCPCPCHAFPKTCGEVCHCILDLLSDYHKTVPDVLSSLRGPWALIYWQVCKYSLLG
jgi:asparagine synthetase B (glutamine-hydrolysing)